MMFGITNQRKPVFRLEPASKELIGHILKLRFSYLSEVNARTIAEFSGGNARIAIAIANTVKRGENLTGLRDNVLFNRLFEQRNEPNYRLLQAAEVCSLVYSFDSSIDDTGNNELSKLGTLAEMSTREIYENVSELIRRDLVQKRSIWRPVLPHAIANKLAQRALENIPINIICNAFENGEKERLLKSFSRRLSFLHDSEEAKEISTRWLKEGGLLGSIGNLNELGISLLKNIAPVNPELVLSSIERVLLLEEANIFFSRNNPNYNDFTRLLCSIAYEQNYFERSANLLCRFALSEKPDENYNSIRKMLKTLFQLYLSGTKATPEQRLNIIDKLVVSNIHKGRELGLILLEVALKTDNFISDYYFEFGSHSRDYGFHPKTIREFQHWYRLFIQYSLKLIMNNGPAANKVKAILGEGFSGLWLKTGLYDELEHCANTISEKGFWGEAWVAVKSIKKHNQETLETSILSRLDDLEKILKPTNLVEHVRVYVLSKDSFSLFDTHDETNSDEFIQIEDTAKSLGNKVGSNYDSLNELLPDILSCNSWLMFSFGQGLAEGTLNSELIWEEFISEITITEKSNINYQVIRGFLNTLSNNSPSLCKNILDDALKNKITAEVFPLLQTSIEINESGVNRLIKSLEYGCSPIWQYSNLAYGRAHDTVNDDNFYKLIKLISTQPEGLEVAIKILHTRLHGQKKNEQHNKTIIGLGQELLTMYQFQRKTSRNDRSDYELSEIIKASYVTNAAKENAKILGEKLVKGFKNYDIYPWDYNRVLEALAITQPTAFLEAFLESNEANREINMLFLDELRTTANPISKINKEVIIEWCEANPKTRYLSLAGIIMPYCNCKRSNKLQWTSLALEIIENSDDPIEILDIFKYSFFPRSWSGSLAEEIERRLPLIDELKEHQDRSVANWAVKQQTVLEGTIRKEREKELNEERRRNKRFE